MFRRSCIRAGIPPADAATRRPPEPGGTVQARGANGSAAGRSARGVKTQSGILRSGLARSLAGPPLPARGAKTFISAKGVGHGNPAPCLGDRVVMAFARYSMERSDGLIECMAGGAAFRLPVPVLRVQGPAVGTLPIATESGDPA